MAREGFREMLTTAPGVAAWGLEATLARAVGMFAIALWDRTSRTLHLARDRFGEKPLYYGHVGTGRERRFGFGSELTTLSALPGFDRAMDPGAISALLQFGYIGAPGAAHGLLLY